MLLRPKLERRLRHALVDALSYSGALRIAEDYEAIRTSTCVQCEARENGQPVGSAGKWATGTKREKTGKPVSRAGKRDLLPSS